MAQDGSLAKTYVVCTRTFLIGWGRITDQGITCLQCDFENSKSGSLCRCSVGSSSSVQEDWYCGRENLQILEMPASLECFGARILLWIIVDIIGNRANRY